MLDVRSVELAMGAEVSWKMIKETSAAIVLIPSQQANPGQFSQVWLVENGVISSNTSQMLGNVFLPVMTNVVTEHFDLFVAPNRVQFALKGDPTNWPNVIRHSINNFVDNAGLAFNGAGINFISVLAAPEGRDIHGAARALFLLQANPLTSRFSTADSSAGLFVTKPIEGGRLQVEIKPALPGLPVPLIPQQQIATDAMWLVTNYHFDIVKREQVARTLSHFDEFLQEAVDSAKSRDSALFN
jgi:hypothetical protein